MKTNSQLAINGAKVEVSNLDKVFYPKTGFTKGNVIDYYIKVSEFLLPHLKDRPITLKRYPDGANGFFFYEKRCPSSRPSWVKTTTVSRSKGGEIDYCVLNGLPALVWAANLADLELHTFQHKGGDTDRPTALVFDLDPGPPADILSACRVGLRIRELFKAAAMECFPKTSGSKGIQICVPLNTPVNYEATKEMARSVADRLAGEHPDLVVAKMQKSLRAGKVFIDWSQNDSHKTTVSVYSLRAKDRPLVSTPVTWDEVALALKRKKSGLLAFDAPEVLKRVRKHGDLFAPVLKLKQKLPRQI